MVGRKPLPHPPPPWIDPAAHTWFITINCQPKGENQLTRTEIWPEIVDSIENRVNRRMWHPEVFLFMPDHCHALLTFPEEGPSMAKIMSDWKHWLAHRLKIRWQRDFFDHRLRRDESGEQKMDYIRQNPVRAGLVTRAEDWPFVWYPKASTPA